MAYGQTGSGKTFTMGSEAHTELHLSDATGLIPRFMNDLFENLQRSDDNSAEQGGCSGPRCGYTLQASFLEVYGEDVHDLLDPARPSLPLREDGSGGVVCPGLTSRKVSCATEALEVLHEGTLNRTTAATLMNLTSSRSHAVFSLQLTQNQEPTNASNRAGSGGLTMTSRFTFVDLAGSERMKKTGTEGQRAREGIKINEGLLALGNVINALADEERLQSVGTTPGKQHRKVHVPYRQSKLTRLLQDALGGNSQTLFLACISPSDTNSSETLSTLHYANRARNIRNAPTKNLDPAALEMQRLSSLVQVLECELVKSKFASSSHGSDDDDSTKSGSTIGEIGDEALMQRPDVLEYLSLVHSKADVKHGSALAANNAASRIPFALLPSNSRRMIPSSPSRMPSSSSINPDGTPTGKSVADFDPSLLAEVNPDEEMAILDQLLEIQKRDSEFDEEQKKDNDELKQVEGELVQQQGMLLQLRDSLKVYHDMKGKYEVLMAEVQQLEVEKAQLAEQLEKATADPTKGCSKAIKKELEKVEKTLARTRNETRRHREMYRKAEQEAKKCAVLERKITDLKSGRARLIKKQKEAATRHREYTEAKTREIMALKRKDRKNEQSVSRLQAEIQMQKKNLDKRQQYCGKLSAKLKQTESHLMKLLSLRQRDLRDRTSTMAGVGRGIGPRRRAASVFSTEQKVPTLQTGPVLAPPSTSLDSLKYLLNQVIAEQVETTELERQFKDCFARMSEVMRHLSDAIKARDSAREGEESEDALRDLEQSVEDLGLKAELVGDEMKGLEMQMKFSEEGVDDAEIEDRIVNIVKDKEAPTLRSLLVEATRTLIDVQVRSTTLSI